MAPEETPEEKLERLRGATERVRARGNFAAQVMARIQQAQVPWYEVILLPARQLLPVAALAAAAAFAFAYQSERKAADVMAMVDEPSEAEW